MQPTFNLREIDTTGERALWQSVIMQAVIDATKKPNDLKGRIEKSRAIAWFTLNNQDFIDTCNFANFNPNLVLRKFRAVIRKQIDEEKRKLEQKRRRKIMYRNKMATKNNVKKFA